MKKDVRVILAVLVLFAVIILVPVVNAADEPYVFQWSVPQSVGVRSPYSVAADGSGNIYVTDISNDSILKYSSDGLFLLSWGSNGTADGQFNDPTGIAVDGSGNVYIADTNNNRIQRFTSSGVYSGQWGYIRLGHLPV